MLICGVSLRKISLSWSPKMNLGRGWVVGQKAQPSPRLYTTHVHVGTLTWNQVAGTGEENRGLIHPPKAMERYISSCIRYASMPSSLGLQLFFGYIRISHIAQWCPNPWWADSRRHCNPMDKQTFKDNFLDLNHHFFSSSHTTTLPVCTVLHPSPATKICRMHYPC